MSAIEHRKRLQARREAAAGDLSQFRSQPAATLTHDVVVVPATGAPVELGLGSDSVAASIPVTATDVAEPGTTLELQVDPVTEVAHVPESAVSAAAVIPVDPNGASTITPEQLRLQAKTTAETLAQLDPDQYQQALTSLQSADPMLYSVVVDELNNMHAATTTEEGDGFDLSAVASGDE